MAYSLRDPCEYVITPRGHGEAPATLAMRPAACLMAACGKPATHKAPPPNDAGSADRGEAASVTLPARRWGCPSLAGSRWRKRARPPRVPRRPQGREARSDWASVVDRVQAGARGRSGPPRCGVAARGRARQARHASTQILAPLASRGRPAISASGARRRSSSPRCRRSSRRRPARVARARRRRSRSVYVAALARAVDRHAARRSVRVRSAVAALVPADAHDGGAVVAQLSRRARRNRIAYVTRERVTENGKRQTKRRDRRRRSRDRHTTRRPIDDRRPPARSASRTTRSADEVLVGVGKDWRALDDEPQLRLDPDAAEGPGRRAAMLAERVARRHRPHRAPAPPAGRDVSADWDDQSLASAIRIGTSNRVVIAPSPGLIDGNTLVWSPDRSARSRSSRSSTDRLHAGHAERAAFVADAATGIVHGARARAGGLAIEWLADRKLAIAGDSGVSIVDLDGRAQPVALERRRPACSATPTLHAAPQAQCTPTSPTTSPRSTKIPTPTRLRRGVRRVSPPTVVDRRLDCRAFDQLFTSGRDR